MRVPKISAWLSSECFKTSLDSKDCLELEQSVLHVLSLR